MGKFENVKIADKTFKVRDLDLTPFADEMTCSLESCKVAEISLYHTLIEKMDNGEIDGKEVNKIDQTILFYCEDGFLADESKTDREVFDYLMENEALE